MKKILALKNFLLALVTLGVTALAAAAEAAATFENNGYPCITELCIGDSLRELAAINWNRAAAPGIVMRGKPAYTTNAPLDSYQAKQLADTYRGNWKPAANYLADGAFDNKSLPLLKTITAACAYKELWGKFATKTGAPTLVKIALMPIRPREGGDANDPNTQQWTVTLISQQLPQVKSTAQQTDATAQLKARYPNLNPFPHQPDKDKATLTIDYDSIGGLGYSYTLALWHARDEREQFENHPACGGKNKVSIG